MRIIVGLGNPGEKYGNTAHNAGFLAVEEIARKFGSEKFEQNKKLKSEIAEIEINKEKVLLIKPLTYMNKSGEAVAAVISFYKIDLLNLYVIHDDSDLLLGQIKIQQGGGEAGHHGVESVALCLKSKEFTRLRIGIRNNLSKAGDIVLSAFKDKDKKTFEEVVQRGEQAAVYCITYGITKGMNKYNQKDKRDKLNL